MISFIELKYFIVINEKIQDIYFVYRKTKGALV